MSLSRSFGILRAYKSKVGPQSLAHLCDIGFQPSGERLSFSDEFRWVCFSTAVT
jgi:hypothetical protein